MALIDDLGKDLESRRWHKAWDNADRHCLFMLGRSLHTSMGAWAAVYTGESRGSGVGQPKRASPRAADTAAPLVPAVSVMPARARWAYMDTRGSSGHNARML